MNLSAAPGYNGDMAAKRRSSRMTVHGFKVVLESIESQNRAVMEAVLTSREETREQMRQLESRLATKIEALEIAVRQNSADIRQNSADIRQNSADIRQNSEDIQRLKEQLAELTDVVRGKADASELAALEVRVAKLEARLGL